MWKEFLVAFCIAGLPLIIGTILWLYYAYKAEKRTEEQRPKDQYDL
jgi:cytochrome bd-type quinol oxidase subunit 2